MIVRFGGGGESAKRSTKNGRGHQNGPRNDGRGLVKKRGAKDEIFNRLIEEWLPEAEICTHFKKNKRCAKAPLVLRSGLV